MIRIAVARTSLPLTPASCSLEEFLSPEWLCRPRPEPIEGEFRLLAGFNAHQHVVVLLSRRLALPVKILRIVKGYLDAGSPRQDWVLFCAPTAQHQVLYPIYVVDFGGMDVPVQYNDLHVLGIRRNHLVWVIGSRDRA